MATEIDQSAAISRVRFLLGDVEGSNPSDETLNLILSMAIEEYTDDDTYYCEIVYYTLIESLRYLVRSNQALAGETGNQSSRKESRGKTTIEVEYSDSSDYVQDGWGDMLSDYISHPEYVCASLKPEKVFSLINVGGVRQDQYEANQRNHNARTVWDLETKSKYSSRRTERRRRAIDRSKCFNNRRGFR